MSNTKKHRPSDEEDVASATAPPPAKKAKLVVTDENGEPRRETLKEQLRRERKEKKERKKAEKKDRKDKKKKVKQEKKAKQSKEASSEEASEETTENNGDVEMTSDEQQQSPEEVAAAEKAKQEKKEKKDKKYNNKDKKEKREKKKAKKEKKAKADKTEKKVATPAESDEEEEEKKEEESEHGEENETAPTGYKQTAALSALPEADVQAFLDKEQVSIFDPLAKKNAAPPRPILQFSHLPQTPLTKQKPFAAYKAPTPIQAASWPFSLAGRDLVGIAETGSGKTMAFAVPCVEALRALPKPAAVEAKKLPGRSRLNNKFDRQGNVAQALAVIVSPTRELAMQTHAALAPLAERVGLTSVCLFGGASKDDQRVLLRQPGGVDIVVATPGRLKDFLSDEEVSLAHVRFAVLDEADRMLDTGFEEDIKYILGQCPERGAGSRQTLMFTATWPTSVRGLAEGFMVDPVKITIGHGKAHGGEDSDGHGNTELQANLRITQTVEVIEQREKERRLLQIIKQEQRGVHRHDRILVFCLYKKEAVRVENMLQGQGVRVCSIHGDLRQEQRTRSLEAFKAGTTSVMVATDVAARGLDIPEVKLVVNVTFPLTIEDYVHRIGRTGRAGKEGRAITFFTDFDKAHSGSLVNVLKSANQNVPEDLLKFGTTVKKKAHGDYGAFFKDVDMSKKGKKITFD